MTPEKQQGVVEHMLFGQLPAWQYSKTFRLLHSCVTVLMLLGLLTVVSWPWTGQWLPSWAIPLGVLSLLVGAVWGTFIFFSAALFQRRLRRQS